MTSIVRKVSVKTLVGKVKPYLANMPEGGEISLARIVGIARGIKAGESNYGPWKALTGDFIAEPLVGDHAGKRFRAGNLFLPDVALDLVAPAVEATPKGDTVQFAFEVTAIVREESSTGYEYGAKTLIEASENDPLEALVSLALPAPSPEPEKSEEKAPALDKPKKAA
jgi:hypothetical protein